MNLTKLGNMKITFITRRVVDYRISLYEKLASMGYEVIINTMEENKVFNNTYFKVSKSLFHIEFGPLIINFPKITFPIRNQVFIFDGNIRKIFDLILVPCLRLFGGKSIALTHYNSRSNPFFTDFLFFIKILTYKKLLLYTSCEYGHVISKFPKMIKKDRISYMNNGLNLQKITNLRSIYNADKRENAVLFIGRFTDKANFNLLIKAFESLKINPVLLHVIGFSLNLNHKNIIFHGPENDESKIAKIANRCKIFVYPGDVGLSIVHAMYYGLPSIIYNRKKSHMPEHCYFKDNRDGLTFKYGDYKDLANSIESLLNNSMLLNQFSSNAIYSSSNSGTDIMSGRIHDFIKE